MYPIHDCRRLSVRNCRSSARGESDDCVLTTPVRALRRRCGSTMSARSVDHTCLVLLLLELLLACGCCDEIGCVDDDDDGAAATLVSTLISSSSASSSSSSPTAGRRRHRRRRRRRRPLDARSNADLTSPPFHRRPPSQRRTRATRDRQQTVASVVLSGAAEWRTTTMKSRHAWQQQTNAWVT